MTGPPAWHDQDNVKPKSQSGKRRVCGQVMCRGPRDPPPLPRGDRFRGVGSGAPCLNLDKRDRGAAPGHDIQLTRRCADAFSDDPIALQSQGQRRETFRPPPVSFTVAALGATLCAGGGAAQGSTSAPGARAPGRRFLCGAARSLRQPRRRRPGRTLSQARYPAGLQDRVARRPGAGRRR